MVSSDRGGGGDGVKWCQVMGVVVSSDGGGGGVTSGLDRASEGGTSVIITS